MAKNKKCRLLLVKKTCPWMKWTQQMLTKRTAKDGNALVESNPQLRVTPGNDEERRASEVVGVKVCNSATDLPSTPVPSSLKS